MTEDVPILLVHGSWHGSWAWRDIIGPLRDRGHRVVAPCLDGLGEHASRLAAKIGLMHHAAQISAVIRDERLENALLVGHSYGGAVLHALEPHLGRPPHAILHLEGALADAGVSIFDGWPRSRQEETLAQLAATGDGWRVDPPDPRVTWPELTPDQMNWLNERMTPQSMASYREPMPDGAGGADCPHYYLWAKDRDPQPFMPLVERLRGRPNWQTAAATGGHELLLTNPAATLAAIDIALRHDRLPDEM